MMKSSSTLVNKNSIDSIALGGFDGMHIAHQELFKHLGEKGAIVCIETGYASLTPQSYREEYTIYPVYYYVLEKIKQLNGEMFIKLLKEEFNNLKKIVVGFDFSFGQNKSCSVEDLKNLFDGKVIVIPEIKLNNISVHSRVIRNFLKDGDIFSANTLLGKPYKIFGLATQGQGLGKSHFVPTINLKIDNFLLPKEGVYITKTIVDNIEYNSVSFIGQRVSTDNSFAIETHILDKDIKFFNLNIGIKFLQIIRENKKFDNFSDLKQEILNDIQIARKYFMNF